MRKKIQQKDISDADKKEILGYINKKLGEHEEIEKIFIEQKNMDVFEVLVVTKKINPKIEREVIEIEDKVKSKFNIPVNLSTLTSACFIS
jgi:hypothetical protein